MRSAAATVAERGADLIDLNMGCPVPKVCKTGAGAALIKDPDTAVAVARAAREGSGLPVTVKLRSGARTGETDGYALAVRLVDEAGVSAIAFHPRSAQVQHKGAPDYELAARLVEELPVPVILSGGLRDDERVLARLRADRRRRGDARPRRARQPVAVQPRAGAARRRADADEVLAELDWVIDRAVEHLGARARRPLPAQVLPVVPRAPRGAGRADQEAFQARRVGDRGARADARALSRLALPA